MKRIVNFRPVFYCFLAFAIGIAFAYFIFSPDFLYIGIVASAVIACLIFALIRKKFKNFICVLIAFIVGIGAFFIDYNNFSQTNFAGQVCSVQGRVSENIYEESNYVMVNLTNVKIEGENVKNFAVCITTYSGDIDLKLGDYLSFTTDIYNQFLFENGTFNSFVYKYDVAYFAYVESENVAITAGGLTLAETVRKYIKSILYQFMPVQEAELSYSVLFGDKSSLDEEVKANFSTSGIAHLLAVSGLHIGFLVALLYWILRKCKCEGIARFCIIAVILLTYCYFCDFSASVVRASIMCLAFLLTKLFGRQYDLLNSIGIAGIIILLIKPLYVFDAGFQMSFVSVLAIAFLYKSFSRFFNEKIKIPKKLSDALAIDLSTTLAIAPILAIYFGKLSAFSWLANLVCIPLFSVGYICLFVIIIFASLISFIGYLLIIPNFIFQAIIWIAGLIASMDWAIISLYTLSIMGAILFYLSLFFASRFFMVKWWKKIVAIGCACVLGCTILLAFNLPTVPNQISYTQLNSSAPCAILTSQSGEVLVVGNGDLEYTEQYLKFKKYNKVATLVLTQAQSADTFVFIEKYDVQNLINFNSEITAYGDFLVKFLYANDIKKGVYIEIDSVGVVFALEYIGTVQSQTLRDELSELNPQILFEKRQTLNFLNVADFKYVFSSSTVDTTIENRSLMIGGSFTFNIENGIIGQIRSVN